MFKEVIGQRTRLDDRVSPVIHPDSLGEELATHAVRLALDRVDAQTDSHHQAASTAGMGSSEGRSENLHSPCLRWWRRSAAKTSMALVRKSTAPSGCLHAPRPRTSFDQRVSSSSAAGRARPVATLWHASAIAGQPA